MTNYYKKCSWSPIIIRIKACHRLFDEIRLVTDYNYKNVAYLEMLVVYVGIHSEQSLQYCL